MDRRGFFFVDFKNPFIVLISYVVFLCECDVDRINVLIIFENKKFRNCMFLCVTSLRHSFYLIHLLWNFYKKKYICIGVNVAEMFLALSQKCLKLDKSKT
jgi:hypothetical protein